MLDFSFWVSVAALVFSLVYGVLQWLLRQRRKCFEDFKDTGIPAPPIQSLINGNADGFWKPNQIESLAKWLDEYGDVFGFYLGDTPFVVVKDPLMIEDIFAKEFVKFTGRGTHMHIHELNPALAGNLVFSKSREWKATRNCMAQFFTPVKLKQVMPHLNDAEKQFIEILGEFADNGKEIDAMSQSERFTFDVICKTAFGIETDVQRNPDNALFKKALAVLPNIMDGPFYNLAQNLYHWNWLLRASGKLIDLLFDNALAEFSNKAKEIIEFRRQNPQVNLPDVAQLLLDDALGKRESPGGKSGAVEGNRAPLPEETMDKMATNCVSVFLGGYDTVRLALAFLFYILGRHQDVQEKVRQEALEAFKKEGDQLSYQTLATLPYINQVVSETLRLYPAVNTFTTRKAEEDYRYGKFLIKKGMSLVVPVYHLHRDPQYWTDPDKFDPERFSPERVDEINTAVYQPFGLGVRQCLGMRLALVELVSVTAQVLRHFRITLGPSQERDLELDTYAFLLVPKDTVWVQVHRLESNK